MDRLVQILSTFISGLSFSVYYPVSVPLSYTCIKLTLISISSLYRFNNYPLDEKAYYVMLHIAGLSLRDLSERYCVTMAS
jgi:hypothetical protein